MKTRNKWFLIGALVALLVIIVAWGPKIWRALNNLVSNKQNIQGGK